MGNSQKDLDEETIQEWIRISEEYEEKNEILIGMYGGDCEMCKNGYTVIVGTGPNGAVNMTSCTSQGCQGKFL